MARLFRRTVPGNERVVTAVVAVPDRWSLQAASLGAVTLTGSPASAGSHAGPGFVRGLDGFGVNRWAGRTTYPLQHFATAIVPISQPEANRLGIGTGASGQPGLPSTGTHSVASPLAWMSMTPGGRAGMGG